MATLLYFKASLKKVKIHQLWMLVRLGQAFLITKEMDFGKKMKKKKKKKQVFSPIYYKNHGFKKNVGQFDFIFTLFFQNLKKRLDEKTR
jgi:hypothetical protein